MTDYVGNKSITVGGGSALCVERRWCHGLGEHMNPWRDRYGAHVGGTKNYTINLIVRQYVYVRGLFYIRLV